MTYLLFTTSNESISCGERFLGSNTRLSRVILRSKAFPTSHFALEVDIDVWNFLELRLIIELALHHSGMTVRRVEGVVDENR